MSENHEGLLETSEAAPLKDDDFPGDFFDDSNEAASFEETSSDVEYQASFESNGNGNGHGETLTLPTPKKPKLVLRGKIGKPEEIPPPGGLVPWTLAVTAFVCIGTVILFGSKPPESPGGTAAAAPAPAPVAAAEAAPAAQPAPASAPAPTPTAVAAAAPAPAAEPAKPVEAPAETTAAAPAPTPTPAPAPASNPAEVLAGELKATQERLAALADKIEALPKPEPPADLKPLEAKVAEQAKSLESVVPLPEKLGKVEESVGGLNTLVTSIKSDLDSLKEEIKKTNEALAALAAKATTPPEPAKPSEFDSAASLFQAGKYKEAQAIFAKLAAENPNDARVFYFAALANGSANNVWTGETETLVNKGIELEKAGTPKAAEIDAAFADLLPQLKTWLGAYRKRVGL